jgi:septum formation protein
MGLWLAGEPLVLASRSAARAALIRGAGIPVEIRPADIDERALERETAGSSPNEVAVLLAREKAQAVGRALSDRVILGADQVLSIGSERLSKPADRAQAREQLRRLRGRSHELHSAFVIARGARSLFQHGESARLTMRRFSDDFLERYLDAAGDAVTQSVGAYQLERAGIHLFEKIEGDYFAILGLPLLALLGCLRREGCLA